MISFICSCRPRSVRAEYTERYKETIRTACREYYPSCDCIAEANLYGIVYYFHRKPTDIDADNLSKPVWDALESIVYNNDKQILLRYAGVFDVNKPGSISTLDLKRFPRNVLSNFLALIDEADHIIYIEVGNLKSSLYAVGVE